MSAVGPTFPATQPTGESEMARRLRLTDWSRTPLGPMDAWPASLRIALGICMNSRFPMFVWWGEQLINLYNDAYIPVLGKRHPDAFGKPAHDYWHEIWPVVGPQAEAVMQRGQATWNERVLLVMERNGYVEDTWFTWSYSPIPDEAGSIGGLFCACTEDTARVVAERERDRLAGELQLSLDAARMGWWRFEPTSRVAALDARAAEIFQVAPGIRSVDDGIAERIHRGDLGRVAAAYVVALNPDDPQPFAVDFRIVRDDGSIRWVEAHGLADFREDVVEDPTDGDGTGRSAVTLVGAISDITERKEAESQLRTSEERLALSVDAAELGTFYCPMPMGEIIWNAKCKEHFWLEPDARVDFERFYAILHPDDREMTRQTVERAVYEHQPYDITYRTVAPDGRQRWIRAKGRAFYGADGQPSRFDGVTLDVTEQKRNDAALLEREAQFRQLADAMPQIVWAAHADGLPYYLNRRWYEFTGLPEAPLLDDTYLGSVVEPDDLKAVYAAWAPALANGTSFECEYRLRHHDGAYRWHLGRAEPIRDASGQVVRWYGTATDIHDQKLAETLLREREQRYRLATRATADTIWDWNLRSNEIRWNEALRAMFGYRPEAVSPTGDWWKARIHPEDRQRVVQGIHEVIDDPRQEVWQAEYRFARSDAAGDVAPDEAAAEYADVLDRGYVLRDADGHATRMIGAMQDLSVRKAIERRRDEVIQTERTARAEAERVSTLKDEFLATLSHELRTPLNAILGWAQILKRMIRTEDADAADGLEVIERNARAQSRIIEDLLDMSRIISGKVRIDVQQADLGAVVASAIETVRPSADAKGVVLLPFVEPSEPLMVSGDLSRLQQVMWNLLSNAIKFTARGGEVRVQLERDIGHAEIRVIDTGEGIAPEFLPHVFDRFRQADSSTTRRHGGLGLGLSIVKQLVELHGGHVRVSSAGAGQGATFSVTLPLIDPPDEIGDRAIKRDRVASDAPDAEDGDLPLDISGVRVLVVDDEADARGLAQRLLVDRGAHVTLAASAAEALELMSSQSFDVLVSDIGMPGTDGHTLMRRIRALPRDKGGAIPSIALTAYARSEDRIKAIAAGFLMHVSKPVEPTELITMVAGAAGRVG